MRIIYPGFGLDLVEAFFLDLRYAHGSLDFNKTFSCALRLVKLGLVWIIVIVRGASVLAELSGRACHLVYIPFSYL